MYYKHNKLLMVMLAVVMSICVLFTGAINIARANEVEAPTETDYVSFNMKEGVSAKVNFNGATVDVDNAIRFVTTIRADEIANDISNYDVKVITIITKTKSLSALGGKDFTKANLDAYNDSKEEAGQAGQKIKYQQVVFAEGVNMPAVNSDGNYEFKACLYNIKDENFAQELSAVSYIEINGVATQYTSIIAKGSLWNTAYGHKSDLEEEYGKEGVLTSEYKDEYDYVSSLCQTYDVTINNATGTPYVQTVKHGEKLSQYINSEFGKGVAMIENFAYPSAYEDENKVDCSNAIITKDTELTAVYGEEGAIIVDNTVVVGVGSKFFDYTTEVEIPDNLGIDEIGAQAFFDASDLTKITMNSVTKIGHEAFFACDKLETVIMPSVTKITVNEGYSSENKVISCRQFMGCYALKTVVVGESFELALVSVGTGDNRCFYVEGEDAVPNQVSIYLTSSDGTATLHAEGATSRVQNMLSGDRVYNLSENENAVCGTWSWDGDEPKLSEYTTHENQDGICSRCGLETTAGLTYTKYTDKEEYYVSSYTGSATEVYVRTKYENLPVTAIGMNVFDGNTRITKVVMPSVTTIGGFAFQNCTALQTVIMPKVTNITTSNDEYYQFYQCNSLTTVVVGENFTVTYGPTGMAGRIFYTEDTSCIGKTKVYISSSIGIMSIASNGNYNRLINETPYCLNETEKDICGTWKKGDNGEPIVSANSSHNYNGNICVNCGEEKATEGLLFAKYGDTESYYVSGYNGSDTQVIIPSKYMGIDVVAIGREAFVNKSTITKVTMTDSVKTIHGGAFFGCSALNTIIMPGVTSITTVASADSIFGRVENNHFYGCTSLAKIVVGASLEVLVGAGTTGGDQRVFWTDGYTGTGIDIYLTSSDGTLYVQAPSRCNMLTDVVYHESKTRPADEAQQAITWTYLGGVPTLWKNIPVAE